VPCPGGAVKADHLTAEHLGEDQIVDVLLAYTEVFGRAAREHIERLSQQSRIIR
jgi:hypothetical protein